MEVGLAAATLSLPAFFQKIKKSMEAVDKLVRLNELLLKHIQELQAELEPYKRREMQAKLHKFTMAIKNDEEIEES